MPDLRVTYHLAVSAEEASARAEKIAIEQTVEVPIEVVRTPFVAESILGRVDGLVPAADGGHLATLRYPLDATALDPAQFLNVLFGNTSLHADVRCVDADVPPALLAALGGPRFGIEGLRKVVGVYDRPLTCTAVKPMGLSPSELSALCLEFARAGIDVVKDDHGLADSRFCPFEERVPACLEAVERAARETGRRSVYAPNLIGSPGTVLRQLRFAEAAGARAVLVSPMLIGLPFFAELCREHANVPVLAHPSFSGALRIDTALLFGKLYRLFGADAVIFVSFGSRFSQSREACRALAENLAAPWGGLLPALPVPAGGITLDRVGEVVDFYGRDSMLLVGGDLQIEAGRERDRATRFAEAVAGA